MSGRRGRTWRWWALIAAGALVLVAGAVAVGVTCIEREQAADLRGLEPYAAESRAGGAAVIYFSRSGSTALVARHIANRLGASLFELSAPDYALGIPGWANALWDAREQEAEITPKTLDLTAYDPIYLGAPIWLYSPAPPIWAFVLANRFDGKRVVLFNTLNSNYGEAYIERFRAAVMERGAREFEHRYVRRGRMTQQISPDALLERVDAEWALEPPTAR